MFKFICIYKQKPENFIKLIKHYNLLSYGYADYEYGYNDVKPHQPNSLTKSVIGQVATLVSSGRFYQHNKSLILYLLY